MPSILFVCTANQYRSPIAAGLFHARLAREGEAAAWQIGSAGTWTVPDQPAMPTARRLAREVGVDLDTHRTCLVSRDLLSTFDLVLVMEAGHKEALLAEFPFAAHYLFQLSEAVDDISYDMPDPNSSPQSAREFVQELRRTMDRGHNKIRALAEGIRLLPPPRLLHVPQTKKPAP